MDNAREWQLQALTPIWTGTARIEKDSEKIVNERLVPTGLLGSIRWWFEVLVRGLGGSACDPTKDGNRCPNSRKKPSEPGHHCVVCELFGCTGWARKFRFQVLAGEEGDKLQTGAIKKDDMFRLRFLPMRHIAPEEWALLDLTLRLIAGYGAIGGKTVLKPSDEPSRADQPHHKDYGIVSIQQPLPRIRPMTKDLRQYLLRDSWQKPSQNEYAWASLTNFWCVKDKYLVRKNNNSSSTFNHVIGREELKNQAQQVRNSDRQANQWLAGRQGESKKVFRDPPRTFGFVKSGTVDIPKIKERLKKAWPDLQDDDILTGEKVLGRLLNEKGKTP